MKRIFLFFLFVAGYLSSQQGKVSQYTPPPPPDYKLNNGGIEFLIPYDFKKTDVVGEIYDNLKPAFDAVGVPISKHLYYLPKSASDLGIVMFSNATTDYNLGENENLSEQAVEIIIQEMRQNGFKGILEYKKINNFNVVKHSIINGSLKTILYYLYDSNKVLLFLSVSAGTVENWVSIEERILRSFKRQKAISNFNLYPFFDLKFKLNNQVEFFYSANGVDDNIDIFKKLDELAKDLELENFINSDKLKKSATINLKGVGGLMVFASDLDSTIDNSEIVFDKVGIEEVKRLLDDKIDKEIPTNINILKSSKADIYLSPTKVCFFIKEVIAKKTDIVTQKIKYDTSVFVQLYHKDRLYTINASYQNDVQKKFIYDVFNSIELT